MLIEELKEKRLTFISPHYDDIPFGCGGLLHLLEGQSSVKIVNIFSHSDYAPNYSFLKTPQDISCIRKAEEDSFCDIVGAKNQCSGFKEASLRGIVKLKEVFAGYKAPRDSKVLKGIVDIYSQLEDFDYIFLPLGFRSHVDHELVVKAADFESDKTFYYEEQLDVGKVGEDNYYQEIEKFSSLEHEALDITHTISRKMDSLKLFRSQITSKEVGSILKGALRAAENSTYSFAERYWRQAV